jgi:RNA polymerase sigma factor (sigma-70 family)
VTSTSDHPSSSPGDIFATTHWSVVVAAGRQNTPQSMQALDELCRTYWYPLYVYIRRRGHSREDAEDLTQSFFARFLEKNYLAGLSHDQGKFRAFLLAALKNFLANEWDRSQRQKRGGQIPHLSLDWENADSRFQLDAGESCLPDRSFDRAWATVLLDRVLTRLQVDCEAQDKGPWFASLKVFLTTATEQASYAEAATALGLSEGATRTAVHRLRQRYRELLRDEIAQTVSDPAHIAEELQVLFQAFAS